MKEKGVLDRITDGKFATILVESIGKQFIVSLSKMPRSVKEGDWFDLIIENDEIRSIAKNDAYTKQRKESVSNIMKKIRKTSGSKFTKK